MVYVSKVSREGMAWRYIFMSFLLAWFIQGIWNSCITPIWPSLPFLGYWQSFGIFWFVNTLGTAFNPYSTALWTFRSDDK